MIVVLCRALTRVIALAVLPVLGLVAAAFALVAVLPADASIRRWHELRLDDAWRSVGTFIDRTAPSGDTAAVLGASGAVLLGLVLVVGALAPAREKELALPGEETLRVRPRALRQATASRLELIPGVARVRVRLRGRGRGRLRVAARRAAGGDAAAIQATVRERVGPIAEGFALKSAVRTPTVRRGRGRTA